MGDRKRNKEPDNEHDGNPQHDDRGQVDCVNVRVRTQPFGGQSAMIDFTMRRWELTQNYRLEVEPGGQGAPSPTAYSAGASRPGRWL